MMHARRCSLAATLLQFLGNSVRTVLALSFVMLAIAAPGVPTVLATGRTSTTMLSAITTLFGSATPCNRAARFGVSPTIACS
jgi:hypothetical protein